MKKIMALWMALVLMLCLPACQETPAGTTSDQGPENTGASLQTTVPDETTGPVETTQGAEDLVYAYTHNNVKLVPGADFDIDALPAAAFVYQVPSCAFEGTDNVYNYGTFELTAYDEGKGPVIYSIFLVDPNMPTDEGLYLGDDVSVVLKLYGENPVIDGEQYTYTAGDTQLIILVRNGFVSSIEFRMAD